MLPQLASVVALLASALAAPSPSNSQKLRHATTGKVVENSYIVVLKDNASREASLKSLNDLVVAFDEVKEVEYTHWSVLNGYSAKLSGAALEHVLNDPNTAYVEENGIVSISWEPAVPRDASPEAEAAPDYTHPLFARAGEGVDVYGIDTGIFVNHKSFGGRASWGAVFGGYAAADGNGHGTHTASTIAGQGFGPATAAHVIAVKVLSDSGGGTFADVVSGVDFVTSSARSSGKPSVANLSLGGNISTAIDSAIVASVASGVHYTVAAGNANTDAGNSSPAHIEQVITVGAIDSAKTKASFSNYGPVLDVWFLGVSVTAAWIGSDTATNTVSGTSMAAPGVAGIVASAISRYGNCSPADLSASVKAAAIADVVGAPSGTTNRRAVLY